jgi:glutamate transport system permease protein
MSSASPTADELTPIPAKHPAPIVTPSRVFNVLGWIILGLLVYFLVIPAIRYGNWSPFGTLGTWEFLWVGLKVTLSVAVFAVIISSIVGFVLALGRLSNNKIVQMLSAGYIELMRALPSYLIIFYVFIVFPKIGITLPSQWFAIIGLSLYTSAVMAEIFRAGILSVEKGQLEAAYALGMKPFHTIAYIVLPQALRRMVPSIVSQLITLTKDTSLASIIALQELTSAGRQLYEYYGQTQGKPIVLETLFVVATIYFVVCYILALISQRLEIKG